MRTCNLKIHQWVFMVAIFIPSFAGCADFDKSLDLVSRSEGQAMGSGELLSLVNLRDPDTAEFLSLWPTRSIRWFKCRSGHIKTCYCLCDIQLTDDKSTRGLSIRLAKERSSSVILGASCAVIRDEIKRSGSTLEFSCGSEILVMTETSKMGTSTSVYFEESSPQVLIKLLWGH